LIDWENIYAELMTAGLLHETSFLEFLFSTPVNFIQKLFKALERRDRKIAIYGSISVAKVATSLSKDASLEDFLAFKSVEPEEDKSSKSVKLSEESIELIKAEIRKKKLPNHIYPILEPWKEIFFS
jgi:hypothetical protein